MLRQSGGSGRPRAATETFVPGVMLRCGRVWQINMREPGLPAGFPKMTLQSKFNVSMGRVAHCSQVERKMMLMSILD